MVPSEKKKDNSQFNSQGGPNDSGLHLKRKKEASQSSKLILRYLIIFSLLRKILGYELGFVIYITIALEMAIDIDMVPSPSQIED